MKAPVDTRQESRSDLKPLEKALGHSFKDPSLLLGALTHPSTSGGRRKSAAREEGAGESKTRPRTPQAYERLEFLGDRVLGILVAEWLFKNFPQEHEGQLAKRHASLVNRDTLSAAAAHIGLGEFLRLSPGEKAAGGARKATILADAFEALLGALYLDAGLTAARDIIVRYLVTSQRVEEAPPQDSKSALQEWAQGRGLPVPHYRVVEQSGPAHALMFEVEVSVPGHAPVRAQGKSKRIAEKEAAAGLLTELQKSPESQTSRRGRKPAEPAKA